MGIKYTTSGLDLPLLWRLSYEVGQRKSGTILGGESRRRESNLELKLIQILLQEKHRITHHHSAKLQTTTQTLTTFKHSSEFTYSDTTCHLNVN